MIKLRWRVFLIKCGLYGTAACVAVYGGSNLYKVGQEVLNATLAAFALMLATGSALFSYGRALDSEKEIQAKIVFAGERALHAAVYMLMSAVLRFGYTKVADLFGPDRLQTFLGNFLDIVVGPIVGGFFFLALAEAIRAFLMILSVLELRRPRQVAYAFAAIKDSQTALEPTEVASSNGQPDASETRSNTAAATSTKPPNISASPRTSWKV